jgi:NTP pyrophosphatase (non-canonical NTP hydrolase)
MELNDYQEAAKTTAVYTSADQQLVCTVLGLNGEAGEVAEKIKKVIRDKNSVIDDQDRKEIQKELGDVLWYLAVLADTLGLDLESVAALNLEKLRSRYQRGTIHGQGDNR